MLNINHSICSSCSLGCGVDIVTLDYEIRGIHPFKNHPFNKGKNCENCIDFIDNIISIDRKESDYEKNINKIVDLLNGEDKENITIITSGYVDNSDLESIINFKNENDYTLLSYEYNFEKIDDDLIESYENIEKYDNIVIIGDVFNENPLIARYIFKASDNGTNTINIDNRITFTSSNTDTFIKTDYANLISTFETINCENALVIINTIDCLENYRNLISFVKEKNLKIIPVLKHPNSFSILNQIEQININEYEEKIRNSTILILINDNPLEVIGENFLSDKKIISINSFGGFIDEIATVNIPVKLWLEKEGSFTNSFGQTQSFNDVINNPENNFKSISEVLCDIQGKLN